MVGGGVGGGGGGRGGASVGVLSCGWGPVTNSVC